VLYAYLVPQDQAPRGQAGAYTNHAPLISIMLPTPTPYGQGAAHAIPAVVSTVVPLETPIPVTPVPKIAAVAPTQPRPAPVRDGALVPPSNINIVLLGTDQRPSQINWRTDTIILLTINQTEKTVGILTIPRDLYVDIPSIGKQRINTADFYGEYYHYPGGGPNLIKQTIEQNLGIRVHYYVRGGFDAFRKAVDILGGIDVDVDCPLYEAGFSDDYGETTLNFQPGLQTMDGVAALRYARSRYTTNDYDRGRRQRKVILAMWDKATSLNLLPKWTELYEEIKNSIQTDLGPIELATLAYIGTQLKMDKIKSVAIDNRTSIPYITPEGAWVLLPNAERIHALLVDFFAPFDPGLDTVELEQAKIQVVGDPNASQIAATLLKRNGLNVELGAPVAVRGASTIAVHHDKPATAQRIAALLRLDPAAIASAPEAGAPYDIVVNLGRDYNSCQK